MNKNLRILAVLLIILETIMIGYSYYIPLSVMGLGVAGIYLLLALSDMIAGNNKYLTLFLVFVSVTISIPRAILQVSDIVEKGRNIERAYLQTIEKPEKREYEINLLDCSRIPSWQGNLQIECSLSNQKQLDEKHKHDTEYEKKLEDYTNLIQTRESEIQEKFWRYIDTKAFSQILLILLVTPILPIVVILLIHNDLSVLTGEVESEEETPKQKKKKNKTTPKKQTKDDRKLKAKVLLKAGIPVNEIQSELGISRSTLYRYKRELLEN